MNRALTLFLSVCVALCLVALSSTALGDDAKRKDAADRALQKELDGQKWYSSENGAPKFLPLKPEVVEKPKPRRVFSQPRLKLGNVGEWIALFALCLCVVLVVVLLVYAYRRREKRLKFELDEITKRKRRVESLAEEARDSYDDLKGAYQRAAKEGDYRSAIIFFFSWILVECDKAELILLDKGKTNLEYWREFESSDPERELYGAAMQVFERVYFGDETLERAEFRELELQAPKFEQALAKRAEQREQERLAREAAKNQLDAARWKQGAKVSRIVIFAALLVLSGGCRLREPDYWKEIYVQPRYDGSINGDSEFARYCGARYDKRVAVKESYSLGLQDADVIAWFTANDVFLYEEGKFLFLYPSELERRAAYDRCLERYAACDPERDWTKFVVPLLNQVFYTDEHPFEYSRNVGNKVADWLNEKPNRVFICFFQSYDASRDYWEAAQKDVERSAMATREGYLRQCRERIGGAKLNNLCRLRSYYIDQLAERRDAAIKLLEMRDSDPFGDDETYLDGYPFEQDPNYAEKVSNYRINYGASKRVFSRDDFSRNGLDLGDYGDEPASEDGEEEKIGASNVPARSLGSHVRSRSVWCRTVFRDYDPSDLETVEEAQFTGDPSWTVGLPEKFPLREGRALVPNEDAGAKTLLALGDVPLVVEKKLGKGKILFVNSTSFVNNFGLVDPTNRLLASRLADEMAPKNGGEIVFVHGNLTTERRRVGTFSDKRDAGKFSLTEASPFAYFALHVIALTVIFFAICWPILGRPRRLIRERSSDFSRHIEAYGEWLKTSDAVQWTREQIDAFNEQYGYNVEEFVESDGQRKATATGAGASNKTGEA